MKKYSTLLIPGLGDDESLKPLKRFWKLKDKLIYTFDTKWATNESASNKFKRLCEFYENLEQKEVIVVCISAGGSLTTQLLSKYPEIIKAIFISSKVRRSSSIGLPFQKRAPALLESVKASEIALQRVENYQDKTIVYRPLFDGVVPLPDMLVGNATKKRVLAIGHAIGIGIALLFYVPRSDKTNNV